MIEILRVKNPLCKSGISCLGILFLCAFFSVDSHATVENINIETTVSTPPPPGVTMNFFRSKVRNNTTVILTWGTDSEDMNLMFKVMRSRNNSHFTEVAIVPGFGTTTEPQTYQFTDTDAQPGRNYYKLVQTNESGRSTDVGTLMEVIGFDDIRLIIAPNPVYQYMSINTDHPLTSDIRIMNISGQVVKVVAPELAANIDLGDLPKGLYVVVTEYGAKKIQVVN